MKSLSIRDAIKPIGDAVRLWWADWANQLLVSLAALLLSLTVVLYPAALFGIYHQAVDLTHDLRTGLAGFWAGFRKHFKTSLLWGLINTFGLSIFGFSVWFYANSRFVSAALLMWFCLIALVLWLTWQFLSLSCFFLQEPQTLCLAWKNGFALMLTQPGFLLPIVIFMLVLTFLSVRYFIPLVAGSEALLCILGLRAVQTTIKPPEAQN